MPQGRVVYYLHPTFKNPIREIVDPDSNFQLKTSAWGEFEIQADVFLLTRKEPIRLKRFLKFV